MTTVQQLQEAGFDDVEVNDYVQSERRKMFDAGFNDKEINDHFGLVPDDSDLKDAADFHIQKMDMKEIAMPESEEQKEQEFQTEYLKQYPDASFKPEKEEPYRVVESQLISGEKKLKLNAEGIAESIIDQNITPYKNIIDALGNALIYPHDFKMDISKKEIKSIPVKGRDVSELNVPFLWAIKSGWETSILGLIQKAPSPESERIFKLLEDRKTRLPFTERLVAGTAAILGDLPSYVIAGLVGSSVSGGNPIATGAAAMGYTQALRKSLMLRYEKGEIVNLKDFAERGVKIAWEGAKGAAVGAATVGAGRLATPGISGLLAETTAMTVTAAVLEGELPKFEDFAMNVTLIGGLHASMGTAAKMRKVYSETGIKPSEVYADVQKNPTIGAELLDSTEEIPRVYQEYKAKIETRPGEAIVESDNIAKVEEQINDLARRVKNKVKVEEQINDLARRFKNKKISQEDADVELNQILTDNNLELQANSEGKFPNIVRRSKQESTAKTDDIIKADKPGEKQPWEITAKEFGVPEKPIDTEVQNLPGLQRIAKESPENLTASDKELLAGIKQQKKEHSKYLRAYKDYVEKSNAYRAAIKQALSEGKSVPAEVLKEAAETEPYSYTKNGYTVVQTRENAKDKSTQWRIELNEEQRGIISEALDMVESSEPPKNIILENGPLDVGGSTVIRYNETYPDFMSNKNLDRDGVVKALRAALEGKDLGIKQTGIVEAALDDYYARHVLDDAYVSSVEGEISLVDESGFDWGTGIETTEAQQGLAPDFRTKEAQRGSISLKKIDSTGFEFEDPGMEGALKRMAEGIQPDPWLSRVKESFKSFGHKLTRTFENLPRGPQFAEAHMILLNFKKYRNIAFEIANNRISHITSRLDPKAYNLFTRKIILEDFIESGERGETLPASFTLENCKTELARVDAEIGKSEFNKPIQESLAARKILFDEIVANKIAAMQDIGIDISEVYSRKNYFRHQVMEYIRAKGVFGSGARLQKRVKSSYEQKRSGYEGDINLNYLQTEHEVVSQIIYDTEVARFYKRLDTSYNIIKKVKADAKKNGFENWQEAIPEKYVYHKIDEGNNFYFVDTIPAKLAKELATGVLEEIGITAEDVHRALAMGSEKQGMVIPEELALTLADMNKTRLPHPFLDGVRKIQSLWKWEKAGGNPFRMLRWHIRNFFGDATFDWISNPGSFSKLGKSLGDLWNCFGPAKKLEGDLADYHKRGGFDTTQQINEMHELNNLKVFAHLKNPNIALKDLPMDTLHLWFKTVKVSNQFREAIMRYAAYLDYKEQMLSDPSGLGKPENFGASIPKEIMALKDIKDRAFMLSNQLHGAYDMVGVIGSAIGDYAQVFYRYKETNFRRYTRLFSNAITNSDGLCQQVGTSVLGRISKTAGLFTKAGTVMAGRMVLKAVCLWAMSSIWNNNLFPDEERDLPEDIRTHHHIIFGRNDDGTVRYFNRLDPLGDFFSILGMDGGINRLQKWMRGQNSLTDVIIETAKRATSNVISGLEPISKTAYELLTRQSLFPNAFKPRLIRNKMQHLLRQVGLENEYNALYKATTGKPIGNPYLQQKTRGIFLYSIDPYASAYNDMLSKQYQFMAKRGLSDGGFYLSPMGNSLYYARQAVRMGDKEGTIKWMAEYMKYGGKFENLYNSIERLMPLEGIPKKYQAEFLLTLDGEDKKKLAKAFKYYEELVTGKDLSAQEGKK